MNLATHQEHLRLAPVVADERWLEVVSHIDPKYGGLSAAVPALGRKLSEAGHLSVSLAAFCASAERFEPDGFLRQQLTYWPTSRREWMSQPSLRRSFEQQLRTFDGVHIHGLWEVSTSVAASTARKLGVPYILSSHGMLEPWALSSKRLKKLVYAALIETRNVAKATCLHALTAAEAQHFIRFGARSPIAVIPNAVNVPQRCSPEPFLAQNPELRGKRLVLFLGRLHPKKGLELLLEAWAAIASSYPDAALVLAGPDTEGTQTRLEEYIEKNELANSVSLTGMLSGALKWSALAAAECFVLPSFSEGLSVSILEAMGMGLPVIVTTPCNMPEVEEYKAGWQVAPELQPLTTALNACLSNTPLDNREIGCRGAWLVSIRYTWPVVAGKMAALYRWSASSLRGPRPGHIEWVLP